MGFRGIFIPGASNWNHGIPSKWFEKLPERQNNLRKTEEPINRMTDFFLFENRIIGSMLIKLYTKYWCQPHFNPEYSDIGFSFLYCVTIND